MVHFLSLSLSLSLSLYGSPTSWILAGRNGITYIQNNTNAVKTQIDIHVSSEIRTHDSSIREGKDGSRLRQRGQSDRMESNIPLIIRSVNAYLMQVYYKEC
jgi:hypothetical protein